MRRILYIVFLLPVLASYGQELPKDVPAMVLAKDTVGSISAAEVRYERDVIDVLQQLLNKKSDRITAPVTETKGVQMTVFPSINYSLLTRFAAALSGNVAFRISERANTSSILTSFTYSQNNQVIFPLRARIWTKNNHYNITADWRYLKYPSYTYGLGGYTKLSDGYVIYYNSLFLHQTLHREIIPDIYAGVGYYLDYYWNVREVTPPPGTTTDFQAYGVHATEKASGIVFNLLYDTRKNAINPSGGNYANVVFRINPGFLGNTNKWQSLIIDARKYIKLEPWGRNILAFWSYNWITTGGAPPYLMLPFTGGDTYCNTGRGYIQGRYRSSGMLYLESEYRFGITRDGLLGGVVFANTQSFAEQTTKRFETISPGYGAGVRIKLNKFSRTNISVDYAFGKGGSRGIFMNLGEAF